MAKLIPAAERVVRARALIQKAAPRPPFDSFGLRASQKSRRREILFNGHKPGSRSLFRTTTRDLVLSAFRRLLTWPASATGS